MVCEFEIGDQLFDIGKFDWCMFDLGLNCRFVSFIDCMTVTNIFGYSLQCHGNIVFVHRYLITIWIWS